MSALTPREVGAKTVIDDKTMRFEEVVQITVTRDIIDALGTLILGTIVMTQIGPYDRKTRDGPATYAEGTGNSSAWASARSSWVLAGDSVAINWVKLVLNMSIRSRNGS